jgi:prevent-host-death family protein
VLEIGVRELRNNVATVIRRAGSGERVIVTVDGRPVAQLGPLTPDTTGVTFDDLIAAGLVDPPARPGPPAPPSELGVPVDVRVDRLLDEVRGRR